MFISVLTLSLVLAIMGGAILFARKRIRKVMREATARSSAREAALLADVAALRTPSAPGATAPGHPPAPPVPGEVAAPQEALVSSVEDDLRAYFGTHSPEPVPAPIPAPIPVVAVPAAPPAAVAGWATALREAAARVEEAGRAPGADADAGSGPLEVAAAVFASEVAALRAMSESGLPSARELDNMDTPL